MLYFYIFILTIYLIAILALCWNTQSKSETKKIYTEVTRRELLKRVCIQHVYYINSNLIGFIVIHIYVTWCAISILKLLHIFQLDSLIGIIITSFTLFMFAFKRLLILMVAIKSVLYL